MENKYRDLHELPLTLRVEDLIPILGIGRNTAYELIRSGQIRSVRSGSRPDHQHRRY
jgi:excisionase family DNA binding protein